MVLAAIMLLLSACKPATDPDYTLRYKVVVTLSVAGRTVSSSAVQDLGFYEGSGLLKAVVPSRITVGVRGEALLADLGQRGALLVPLTKGGAEMSYESMIFWACAALKNEEASADYIARVTTPLRAGCEVPARALPMFIWIPDLQSSEGLVRARPPNMSEVIGMPVSLISVRLEATDEDLTTTVAGKINWLKDGMRLPAMDEPLNQELYRKDFVKTGFL